MSSSFEMPVSKIKVRIPPIRHDLVSRPRLIELLNAHLDRNLLFVVAPAGYGKTSLLVDMSTQIEMPVCWLSLDEIDQDPQRFLRYLIASLAERFPDFGRDSLSVLGGMTALAADQEQILVTLTNEIGWRIHDHFLLVLDDFHQVEQERSIRQLLDRFLQLCGDHVHVVISSRILPDLAVAPLMIARNQAGGISFEDLTFQREELQNLFRQNFNKELSPQEADTILKETEGWVAAIHLGRGVSNGSPPLEPLQSSLTLFDFFSREVMQRQPEEIRRFMYMTSLFDAFDIDLCQRVLAPLATQSPLDFATLFRQVQPTSNFFSMPLDQDGHWIRYHHLFQHYLRSQLQFESPVLFWSIQQRLAEVYEQDQKYEEALHIYAELDDPLSQIRLLIRTGADFIRSGRILSLDTWLRKIPIDLAYSQPDLLSLMGAVYTTQGDQRQALEILNLAEPQQRNAADPTEWYKTLVRRAEVHRLLGRFEEALQDVDRIREQEAAGGEPGLPIVFAEARRVRGLALFGLGRTHEALDWLRASLQQYRELGQSDQIPILETELGVIHRRLGDIHLAARYYASALSILEKSGNTGWKARLLNNMGMLKYMTGQMVEAYQLLQEAVRTAGLCGYVRIQTNALISLGDLLCDLGQLKEAFECYDRALTHAMELGHSLYIFYASLGGARLQRLRGDPRSALTELRQVEVSQVKLGSYEQAFFNLERGLCLLETGQTAEAEQMLRETVDLFRVGGNQVEGDIALLWHAASLSLSDAKAAVSEVSRRMPPQREWQRPTPFMLHAGRIARWLKTTGQIRLLRASRTRVFFEHALRVLDTLPSLPRYELTGPVDQNSQIPRLGIETFGEVRIQHQGKTLQLSDWQTREARDLFLYLLQSPPSTKEQIATEFWPDLSPARIKMRFKINIYRIRKALGHDSVLFQDGHYTFNRSLTYTWDREHLEKLAGLVRQEENAVERARIYEQMLVLLRKGYLKDVDAEWAAVERGHFQERLRQVLLEAAELQLEDGQGQKCLDLAHELLELEPLLESAHRVILQAYAIQHNPAGLANQYHQYREILENELGMLPSREMRTLYEKLMTTI